MTPDRRQVTLNEPPVVEALQWMTQVYDSLGGAAAVYAFQSSAQTGQLDPFLQGKGGAEDRRLLDLSRSPRPVRRQPELRRGRPASAGEGRGRGPARAELGERMVFRDSVDRQEQGGRLGAAKISFQPAGRGRDGRGEPVATRQPGAGLCPDAKREPQNQRVAFREVCRRQSRHPGQGARRRAAAERSHRHLAHPAGHAGRAAAFQRTKTRDGKRHLPQALAPGRARRRGSNRATPTRSRA